MWKSVGFFLSTVFFSVPGLEGVAIKDSGNADEAADRALEETLLKHVLENNFTVVEGRMRARDYFTIAGLATTAFDMYKKGVTVHINDLEALNRGDHRAQAHLAPVAQNHPVAFAVLNIHIAGAQGLLTDKANGRMDSAVKNAIRKIPGGGFGPLVMKAGIKAMGSQAKKELGDALDEFRDHAVCKIVQFYTQNGQPAAKVVNHHGDDDILTKIANILKLSDQNGALAMATLLEQATKKGDDGDYYPFDPNDLDYVTVSNYAYSSLMDHTYDEGGEEFIAEKYEKYFGIFNNIRAKLHLAAGTKLAAFHQFYPKKVLNPPPDEMFHDYVEWLCAKGDSDCPQSHIDELMKVDRDAQITYPEECLDAVSKSLGDKPLHTFDHM